MKKRLETILRILYYLGKVFILLIFATLLMLASTPISLGVKFLFIIVPIIIIWAFFTDITRNKLLEIKHKEHIDWEFTWLN
jgi:ABC-type dipeptide/oligopeptide/nickel transport system permease subunit